MKRSQAILILALALVLPAPGASGIVDSVLGALSKGDPGGAYRQIQTYRASRGVTPELLDAMSWFSRAALVNKSYGVAEQMSGEVYRLATDYVKRVPLNRDTHLQSALGAAIEVQAQTLAETGRRSEAVSYLTAETQRFAGTPIQARIQKNALLLTLEGKPAPALEGVALPKGKPALLFFWAHWCPDCKAVGPLLAQLKTEFAARGLTVISPTQKYGYVAGGVEASPEVESAYIEKIRRTLYRGVVDGPLIINEANFLRYGASTTPTLVLVDRTGIVRLYHPGAMTYAELRAAVQKIL